MTDRKRTANEIKGLPEPQKVSNSPSPIGIHRERGDEMSNERVTENIVRDFLRKNGYYDDEDIIVEEQKSANPRIQKLLKTASKKGGGQGYPEFIIRSKAYSDFLIVIECKADAKKHKSKNLDRYSEYAVDGAIYYASHLSREFNVMAIGVSGQKANSLRVSHYLYLQESETYQEVSGDSILSFDDYHRVYSQDPSVFNQEYQKLLDYSKEINEELHAKKVKESQRSLLISGILIALRNSAFVNSYKKYKKAIQLAKNLVSVIGNELSNEDLPEERIGTIKKAFSFVQTHTTLSRDKEFLQNLIQDIDRNINSFMRTYQYIDTIGQFYIEFLRYANNDKGLGIVLTPPHITDLFCKLADVNKDSIVVDNCCGTAGFLISALKRMVEDAKGDSKTIQNIRFRQIVGIEYDDIIYALSISNMMLHEDGKSNIYQGDCFELQEKIKRDYRPNIGFLNPPYRTKKGDREELEFVLNNLDMLEPNGRCIAIIPISCVLAGSGEGLVLKEDLLRRHTLDAVLSMPIDLFHNSKVGVVTVVLVVTAHKPHPKNKKTWFGYWRDDGFEKVKGKGRVDASERWQDIEQHWVDSFKNRQIISGFSVMKKVTATSEWCAEAYLETDYSDIDNDLFEKELKKYIAYRVMNE